ncbi:hypothetical protein SASPL_147288 [Salvia splendens]|uniref:Uncharacterized protein n=1 Tax=Salvia splendens TaxID=180675 RepID=A0A8X8Z6D2_SALSN|nr:UPF0481 protein At3g47200-like [Salvia splendens]KAG6393058.1 hypothetical protein SASPL_147288 [Salvia splendens]
MSDFNVNIHQLRNDFSNTHSNPSIYRVNDSIRSTNEKAYDPMIISIGPLHRGKSHLKAMEKHKRRYREQLLENSGPLDVYKDAIRSMVKEARDFYAQEIALDDNEFLDMLVLDGLFIVEFLREYKLVDGGGVMRDRNPIFDSEYIVSHILRDLMLFENQIPMSVVEALFCLSKKDEKKEFKDLIWPLSRCHDMPHALTADDATRPKHLLGLVHSVKCFSFAQRRHSNHVKRCEKENINSAMDLTESGIVFRKKAAGKDCSDWLDITFEKRTLYIPELRISDETESLFRNMIAHEYYRSGSSPRYVSDYVFFLHCLMSSTKDVEVLRRCGVISNWLGGDARVYEVVDRLGTNVFNSRDFSYEDVFSSINEHCGLKWNKWIAVLRRHHFNNPWTMLSLVAAVVLLTATIVQTVFTVLSFYKKT